MHEFWAKFALFVRELQNQLTNSREKISFYVKNFITDARNETFKFNRKIYVAYVKVLSFTCSKH